jgi:hypothetical protein
VFEFRRRQRELAGELIARLTPPPVFAPAEASNDASAFTPLTTEERADPAQGTAFWGAEP